MPCQLLVYPTVGGRGGGKGGRGGGKTGGGGAGQR